MELVRPTVQYQWPGRSQAGPGSQGASERNGRQFMYVCTRGGPGRGGGGVVFASGSENLLSFAPRGEEARRGDALTHYFSGFISRAAEGVRPGSAGSLAPALQLILQQSLFAGRQTISRACTLCPGVSHCKPQRAGGSVSQWGYPGWHSNPAGGGRGGSHGGHDLRIPASPRVCARYHGVCSACWGVYVI